MAGWFQFILSVLVIPNKNKTKPQNRKGTGVSVKYTV